MNVYSLDQGGLIVDGLSLSYFEWFAYAAAQRYFRIHIIRGVV